MEENLGKKEDPSKEAFEKLEVIGNISIKALEKREKNHWDIEKR